MEHYTIKTKKSPQVQRTAFTHDQLAASDTVTASALTSQGTLVIGTDKGALFRHSLNGEDRFCKISGVDALVTAMCAGADGCVFVASDSGVYVLSPELTVRSFQLLEENAVDMICAPDGSVYLLTPAMLYLFDGERFTPQQAVDFGTASAIAVNPAGEVFVTCGASIMKRFGKRLRWGNMMRGMTGIPEAQFTALKSDGIGTLWVGCEDGLHLFDGKSEWLGPENFDFFPQCRINTVDFGKNGAVYLGTDVGLYIVNGEKTRFYGKGRYLCGEKVYTVQVCDDENAVWVGTDGGICRLEFVPYSLSEKEAHYDSLTAYFLREGYFTGRWGTENGDITTGQVAITDNDGLWSAVFAASQCLKYAVTKKEEAKENARATVNALMKLHYVTGIPGFPARAYRRPGEDSFGDGDPEWHLTSDETGPLEWKGDTSSDELTGHFYAMSWYYDLCADLREKEEIARLLKATVDHLLAHGYTLCDTDGLPTTWAHFGPSELNGDDTWCWEKGINSLELLTFLCIVYRMTGDERYLAEERRLAGEAHYAMNLTLYKKYDAHSCHIDDLLGFYNITHLLRLERDEALLRYVKLALRRHYEYERIEHTPYYHFVTAWALGGHAALDEAVESLEEYPLDVRKYPMRNSVRPDVTWEPDVSLYGEDPHLKNALPYSERPFGKMCYNAFQADEGGDGSSFCDPAAWLLAYWFGRYAGLID